jgi:hypothetical protein
MDKEDKGGSPSSKSAADADHPTEVERRELSRRSEEHRRNPYNAIPLEDALESIERSLGCDTRS